MFTGDGAEDVQTMLVDVAVHTGRKRTIRLNGLQQQAMRQANGVQHVGLGTGKWHSQVA